MRAAAGGGWQDEWFSRGASERYTMPAAGRFGCGGWWLGSADLQAAATPEHLPHRSPGPTQCLSPHTSATLPPTQRHMPNVGFYQPIGADVLQHGKGARLPKHVAMCVRCSGHAGCWVGRMEAAVQDACNQATKAASTLQMCPTHPPPSAAPAALRPPCRLKSAFDLPDDPARMYGVTEEEAQVGSWLGHAVRHARLRPQGGGAAVCLGSPTAQAGTLPSCCSSPRRVGWCLLLLIARSTDRLPAAPQALLAAGRTEELMDRVFSKYQVGWHSVCLCVVSV